MADYKFYCFGGEPRYCQVIRDRSIKETIDFYDMDWNLQPFVGLAHSVGNGVIPVARPSKLETMRQICRKLADGPFTRIDLYIVNDKIYFGEITFFPLSGLGVFTPDEWSYKIGDMVEIYK